MKVLAGEHNQHLAAKRQILLSCDKNRAKVKVNIWPCVCMLQINAKVSSCPCLLGSGKL